MSDNNFAGGLPDAVLSALDSLTVEERQMAMHYLVVQAFEPERSPPVASPIDEDVSDESIRKRHILAGLSLLTPRELDVLSLFISGMTIKEIAGQLFISPRTVEVHLGRTRKKIGSRRAIDLVRDLARVDYVLPPMHHKSASVVRH